MCIRLWKLKLEGVKISILWNVIATGTLYLYDYGLILSWLFHFTVFSSWYWRASDCSLEYDHDADVLPLDSECTDPNLNIKPPSRYGWLTHGRIFMLRCHISVSKHVTPAQTSQTTDNHWYASDSFIFSQTQKVDSILYSSNPTSLNHLLLFFRTQRAIKC